MPTSLSLCLRGHVALFSVELPNLPIFSPTQLTCLTRFAASKLEGTGSRRVHAMRITVELLIIFSPPLPSPPLSRDMFSTVFILSICVGK
ncbi:hypothetical protein RHGRI_008052 [Rhododendron griersonianum]|uniref:Uncharacterized protein n=1 Tax=Rhododendron griersonianum TaxID=479676 RepID=A0AAV6L016_9ERIC|nr:hypothetical protein RHGRI_008052 [Rhododendron griersonianum]